MVNGQETGDRRQETGDGRQETGDRRQETELVIRAPLACFPQGALASRQCERWSRFSNTSEQTLEFRRAMLPAGCMGLRLFVNRSSHLEGWLSILVPIGAV